MQGGGALESRGSEANFVILFFNFLSAEMFMGIYIWPIRGCACVRLCAFFVILFLMLLDGVAAEKKLSGILLLFVYFVKALNGDR